MGYDDHINDKMMMMMMMMMIMMMMMMMMIQWEIQDPKMQVPCFWPYCVGIFPCIGLI